MTILPPARRQQIHRRPSRILGFFAIFVIAGVLWACGEDSGPSEDRRFANEPSTAVPATATPELPDPTPVPTSTPAEASPESLLDVRGAPTIIAALVDDDIHIMDTATGERTANIASPASYRFAAIAQSPVADQVAALIVPAEGSASGQPEVVIYDGQGHMVHQWTGLTAAETGAATPAAREQDQGAGNSISWSPQGDRLLVTLGGSALVGIETAGEARAIPMLAPFQGIAKAAWSPRGDQIALLAHDADGTGIIWVFAPYVDGVSLRQIAPPNTDAADLGSVTTFSWLPDGSGLAYILAGDTGSGAAGGQLHTVNIRLDVKLLVATAGRGGPAARIVDFVPSPDGQSVAYTIAIPDGADDDGWQVHSVWVRSLLAPVMYNVPIGDATVIDRLWFVEGGLAWQQRTGDETEFVVHRPAAEGNVILSVVPVPVADATPGASPIAATPRATPIAATPILATPDATPAVDTALAATPINAATPGG